MLKVLLGLPEIAQEDASDALAVAICHINSHELLQKAGPAIPKRRTSWRNYIP
jgi:crossover junction endodeoxyribonuclease RuvC